MTLVQLLEELYQRDKKLAINVGLAINSQKWERLPPPYSLDHKDWNAHVLGMNPAPCVSIMVRIPLRGSDKGGLNMVMHTWTRPAGAAWRIYRMIIRAKPNRRKHTRFPLKWPFLFYDCYSHTLVRYHSRTVPGRPHYTEKQALDIP